MARVSEASYRRGFQQGIVIGQNRIIDPVELRFKRSLDQSPFTDGEGGMTAKERLYAEYGVLVELGFFDLLE
jgi:hypothetical protein